MNHDIVKQNSIAKIEQYWQKAIESARVDKMNNRNFKLPLARIKRLMKVEEEVKMVANEVPVLFSKVTEHFVEELTLRAWINTESNRRRILQKNDLGVAVKTSDMFDFLIYVIPKGESINEVDYNKRLYENKIEEHTESDEQT
ncbi:CCAAT- binding transcription factor component, partial [Conglomerata obtusa]